MKPCMHLNNKKECTLGISPLKCKGCSMFKLQPFYMKNKSNISSVNLDKAKIPEANVTSSSQERAISMRAAVIGGCNCNKNK